MTLNGSIIYSKYDSYRSFLPALIDAVAQAGFCSQEILPDDTNTISGAELKRVYKEASKFSIRPHKIEPSIENMKSCLNGQLPFIMSLNTELFTERDVQIVNNYQRKLILPSPYELLPVLVVGYDDRIQVFLARNTWDPKW
ncbi:unnamed protein product, partial [Didymodactylos carnosus]